MTTEAMFLRIKKAHEVLINPKERQEYDVKVKAKLEKQLRDKKLDAKRRKLKEGENIQKRKCIS